MHSTLSTAGGVAKRMLGDIVATEKGKDLQQNRVDSELSMTTDHGVKVRDTDNWCVFLVTVMLDTKSM